jgi:hypothetical protein
MCQKKGIKYQTGKSLLYGRKANGGDQVSQFGGGIEAAMYRR